MTTSISRRHFLKLSVAALAMLTDVANATGTGDSNLGKSHGGAYISSGWRDVSLPTASCKYPEVPGIECADFTLPNSGLTQEQQRKALLALQDYQSAQKANFLGYQANQALDFETDLKQYLNFHINNLGDPFKGGNFTVNSKWMERAVLDYYAALWRARWPHDPKDPESYWGYVVSMGCTEGNIYGLWNARDYLAGKTLLDEPITAVGGQRKLVYQQALPTKKNRHAYTPVAFYSDDTHYSIIKAMRVLGIHTFYEIGKNSYPNDCPVGRSKPWPMEVPSEGGNIGPGSIDVDALAKLVEFFAARGYPILVCLNYGTTFKGAYDDVEAVGMAIMPILKRYGLDQREVSYDHRNPLLTDPRTGYWIHVDGALGAAYMPFIEMAHRDKRIPSRGPIFDFRLPWVHSISMSGHKWIGAPWPCGIYMTKVKMQLRPPDDPEYIGSPDSTFAGSRNGLSAMILWDYLAKHSYERQIERALNTEELATYAETQLRALEERISSKANKRVDLWIHRTPLSLTIRFKRPKPEIVFKYSLSGEDFVENGQERGYSHIYIMPHVTRGRIDNFIRDLEEEGAFREQPQPGVSLPVRFTTSARTLLHVPHEGRGYR